MSRVAGEGDGCVRRRAEINKRRGEAVHRGPPKTARYIHTYSIGLYVFFLGKMIVSVRVEHML